MLLLLFKDHILQQGKLAGRLQDLVIVSGQFFFAHADVNALVVEPQISLRRSAHQFVVILIRPQDRESGRRGSDKRQRDQDFRQLRRGRQGKMDRESRKKRQENRLGKRVAHAPVRGAANQHNEKNQERQQQKPARNRPIGGQAACKK